VARVLPRGLTAGVRYRVGVPSHRPVSS
jgi:hypothetical protein